MKLLKRLWRARPKLVRHPMIGKVMMDVQLDGCMAHVAKIQRVGIVIDVKSHEELYGHSIPGTVTRGRDEYAICQPVQAGLMTEEEGEAFYIPLFTPWLAPMPNGVGYIWRH
ncbi:hypothetical protein [Methylobacterium ajmalii]|uniref:hypothetical protein n=1 Tax=Methylobacterium ajmalii TaxID=2738439 RepID=UPI002F3564C8